MTNMEKLQFMEFSLDLDAITAYCQIKGNQPKNNSTKKSSYCFFDIDRIPTITHFFHITQTLIKAY